MNDALAQENWAVPSPYPSAISLENVDNARPLLIQSSVIQSVAQHTALKLNLGSSQHATLISQKIVTMKLQSTLNSSQQLEDRELTVD